MDRIGIFIRPDKKKYVGQYKYDKKSGYGVFVWPDGKKYEGSWHNGKQHGNGVMLANGEKKIGEWKNGQKMRWIDDCASSEKIMKNLNESASIFKFNDILINNLVESKR